MIQARAHSDLSSKEVSWQSRVLFDALTDDKLELTLFPTEHCNFRCTYCYEDFSIGRMSPSVVGGVKELIRNRSADLSQLQISWFGGEPLIAYDIVLDINRYASEISAKNDIELVIGMTTNGYALSEVRLIELYGSGLRHYQISLDGFGEAHDRTRLRADGKRTFDVIWSNLLTYERLRNDGILNQSEALLRLHVHPENPESSLELARAIREHLSPANFSYLIKNVGYYGGKNDGKFDIFKHGAVEFADLKSQINEILSPFMPDSPGSDVHVCYAAKANAFTVRADGRVGKCTVALQNPRNDIGSINSDGSITFDGKRAGLWLHAIQSLSQDDLACPLPNLPQLAP